MSQTGSDPTRPRGLRQLAACCGIVAVIWLYALPWWAQQPGMAAHLQSLEDQGIDASAMFYTELDALDPVLQRLEATPHPTAEW